MELGSAEHKQLLIRSIVRVSLKVASVGLFIGFLLMVPYLVRENAFSSGLFYMGIGITVGSLLYALILAYKKYQKLIKPFAEEYPQNQD